MIDRCRGSSAGSPPNLSVCGPDPLASPRGEWLLCSLHVEKMRLIAARGTQLVFRSERRGIDPLLELLDAGSEMGEERRLRGASFADSVVGKASALLLAFVGASFVATDLLSDAAADVLAGQCIPFYARKRVRQISGRVSGEACPFERAVTAIDSPAEAVEILASVSRRLAAKP